MYNDVESDYWKDVFSHMQHKNMMRIEGERLSFSDCEKAFERFAMVHPEIKTEITRAASYCTWEFFITPKIKFRLYIQNQIKASLHKAEKGELVKICDAKFQKDPFPEIYELIKNKPFLEVELEKTLEENVRTQRQLQLAFQFIKAYAKKHFDKSGIIWSLETAGDVFKLKLTRGKDSEIYELGVDDFKEKIDGFVQ